MTNKTVERHIQHIINCSNDNLYFLNVAVEDIPSDHPKPIVLCQVETGGIADVNVNGKQRSRIYNVMLQILVPVPKRVFVGVENSKKKRNETAGEFSIRLNDMRENFVDCFEDIIGILVSVAFPFRYELFGDVDYYNVDPEDNSFGLFGKEMRFTVKKPWNKRPSIFSFDTEKIKQFKRC